MEIGRVAAAQEGKLTRDCVQQAIRAKGHTVGGKRLTEVMKTLRRELDTTIGTRQKGA